MTHIDNARPECIWGICWDANGDICQVLDDQGHAVPLLLEQPEPEEETATSDPPAEEEEEEDSSMGLQSRLLHMLLEVLDENPLQLDAQELMEQKLMLIAGGINDPLLSSYDLPSTTLDHNWNVMRPLCNRSSIMAKRVCFANNLQMFEPLPNRMGHCNYRMLSSTMECVPLKSMILLEFGQQQLPLLFGDVLCVVRHELIEVVVQSRIVGNKEPHSGRNIFGEATRISLSIRDKEIGLSNSILKQLTSEPDTEIVFFVNPNYIYVLNGRTLLECAELGRHLVPMKNIDYTPS